MNKRKCPSGNLITYPYIPIHYSPFGFNEQNNVTHKHETHARLQLWEKLFVYNIWIRYNYARRKENIAKNVGDRRQSTNILIWSHKAYNFI